MPSPSPDPLLSQLRVVRLSHGVAARYAARCFAQMGAKVTGLATSDPAHAPSLGDIAERAFFDAGQLVLDAEDFGEGAQVAPGLAELLGAADIVIDQPEGLESAALQRRVLALRAACPLGIVVTITPFGLAGPYAGWRGGDLEVSFLAGLAHLTPRDIARPNDLAQAPPLKMPGALVSIYTGASAAAAAMAVLAAGSGPEGRRDHVDVSMLETMIPALRREVALQHYTGHAPSRFMRVWRLAPYGVKACADGHVFLQVVEPYHWRGLVEMMGSPDWATDERYLDAEFRFEHRADIEARIAPWIALQPKLAFALEAQRRGVPFAPVNPPANLLRIPQLHAREFFRVTDGDAPCVLPGVPQHVRRPAGSANPERGIAGGHLRSATKAQGAPRAAPLAGLRVVDFGHVWAGPYCAALLADMGADVVKVESRQRVDIHRRQGPYPEGRPGLDRSGVWNTQNRNKRSLTLNLAEVEGRRLAAQLVSAADVAIENFAPGVMKRLGLDYDTLSAFNPGLVMASLSAFGQTGPQHHYVGYGPSLDAWSGLDYLTAYAGGAPNALGGMFPDTSSGIHAAFAILSALEARRHDGQGRFIDLSELEVSALLIGDLAARGFNGEDIASDGNGHPRHFPHGAWQCQGEDRWISLSVTDDRAWQGLCGILGRTDWLNDARLRNPVERRAEAQAIETAISEWAATMNDQAAMERLQSVGVAAGRSHTVATLLQDKHLVARGFFETVTHPEAGAQPMYRPIWSIAGEQPGPLRPAPRLGEHSASVLHEWLGLSAVDVSKLEEARVVY